MSSRLQFAGRLETNVVSQYVWGERPGHRDELILRDGSSSSGSDSGDPSLDERQWCLMDYYDPTSIVDNSGSVVERYRFSAFGLRSIMASDFSPRINSDYDWYFAFKGQFLDLDTGYYNYGYRYYSPELGRWLSRDPIGEKGGDNLYDFCANQPLINIDRFGLFTLQDAVDSLAAKGVSKELVYSGGFVPGAEYAYEPPSSYYSDKQIFDEWLALEGSSMNWYASLPRCPKCISIVGGKASNPDVTTWTDPNLGIINGIVTSVYHPGAAFEMRTVAGAAGSPSGNQCTYDSGGKMIYSAPGAGTADRYGPNNSFSEHQDHDVKPFNLAEKLGKVDYYYWVRPIW